VQVAFEDDPRRHDVRDRSPTAAVPGSSQQSPRSMAAESVLQSRKPKGDAEREVDNTGRLCGPGAPSPRASNPTIRGPRMGSPDRDMSELMLPLQSDGGASILRVRRQLKRPSTRLGFLSPTVIAASAFTGREECRAHRERRPSGLSRSPSRWIPHGWRRADRRQVFDRRPKQLLIDLALHTHASTSESGTSAGCLS